MSKLYPKEGHIYLENGGYRTWSSDGRPVNLLPIASRITQPLTVAFPDFTKRNAYALDVYIDPMFGDTTTSCGSWSTIIPQEWSSGNTVLAPLPEGCNFVDVRVTLNRTKNPDIVTVHAPINILPTQQTFLPGGSALCERAPIWKRAFHIVISGSNIVLWRQQSVYDGPNGINWADGNSQYTSNGGYREGFTYGGGSGAQNGHLAKIIQGKSGGSVNKRRGESNGCSLNDNTDHSSTWTGSVQLWPGYIAA